MKIGTFVIILLSLLFVGMVFLFSILHLEIEYTSFKVCYVDSSNISEELDFFVFMDNVEARCMQECNYPNLLNGGVGVNSKGYHCTYKSIF